MDKDVARQKQGASDVILLDRQQLHLVSMALAFVILLCPLTASPVHTTSEANQEITQSLPQPSSRLRASVQEIIISYIQRNLAESY